MTFLLLEAARSVALTMATLLICCPAPAQQRVRIIAVGDSYSSGEGNPDQERSGRDPAQWQASGKNLDDARMRRSNFACDRSNHAWPRLLADEFERRSGRTVEFLSFACSGAQIPDLIEREQADGTQLSHVGPPSDCPHRGADALLGQLCEVERHFTQTGVAGTSIDALVMTIGGNDVGFAPAVMTCVSPTNCSDPLVRVPVVGDVAMPVWPRFSSDIEAGRAELRRRFSLLGSRIEQINKRYLERHGRMLINNVFAVEYPAAFRDEQERLCGLPGPGERPPLRSLSAPDPLDLMTSEELRWGEEQVLPALNGTVQECMARLGRSCDPAVPALAHAQGAYGFFVGGVSQAFRNHGFCAGGGKRWIVRVGESLARQGTSSGSVHPNRQGHEAVRDFVLPQFDRLVPPAAPQLRIDMSTLTPTGLQFNWQGLDARATFLQFAKRGAADQSGRTRLERPAEYPAGQLGTPPRFPGAWSGNDWRIEPISTSGRWTAARPQGAADYVVRACTEAACSTWSQPLRVAVVQGDGSLPRLQGLEASIAGRNGSTASLRLKWRPLAARPNAFVEISAASGRAKISSESDAPEGTVLKAAAGSYSITARHCVAVLATSVQRHDKRCGLWSDAVAVDGNPAVRGDRPELETRPPPAIDPNRLRPPSLPR